MNYFWGGCAFWGVFSYLIIAVRPGSSICAAMMDSRQRWHQILIAIVLMGTILVCILPMSLSPRWNGEAPIFTNQYEVLTESILDGRIDLDYGDMDPRLLEMENPYDPGARSEAGVNYHWDHALYNGKYYMYFGVVPVFLLFLPFRILTGASLTTYHATQIFTAVFIVGVFALFAALAKRYFRRLPLSVYLSLAASMSLMSTWYFADAPAMYCTAISAGICMEVWSFWFFFRFVTRGEKEHSPSIRDAVLGSLFGALAFGCRPTVALVNFFAAPYVLVHLIRKRTNWVRILSAFSPYLVIGILLMIYNYIRFDNPLEFGQSYQLTLADQSQFGDLAESFDLRKIRDGLLDNFIGYRPLGDNFPYVDHQSVFMNFPVCLVAGICLLQKDTLISASRNGLLMPILGLILSCVLITIIQILQAPWLLERYRADIYWIIGIIVFLSFGIFLDTTVGQLRDWLGFAVSVLGILTVLQCFLLWSVPLDHNFTDVFPEYTGIFANILSFGVSS